MNKGFYSALFFLSALFILFVLPVFSAASTDLLQFRAGNHIIGFAPDKAYLAGMDHALTVEFLGTKGVRPVTDKPSSAKTQPLDKVTYKELWKGISLTYETVKNGLTESTYHVTPGSDVSDISLKYNVPVEKLKDGSLRFTFKTGYMIESAPIAWQDIDGKRIPVKVAFRVSNGEVGFEVAKYDKRHLLIIDPSYYWHAFYGSDYYEHGNAIAVDGNGNIYVTGSSDRTWGAPLHQHSGNGKYDIVILKLDSSGNLLWHTFYGSDSYDYGNGIALDGSRNVYVTGQSQAGWGTAPRNDHAGGSAFDIVVLKLDTNGAFQWNTFYGSTSGDYGKAIALDIFDRVYVAGTSDAAWGSDPKNEHSGAAGGTNNADIVIVKLDSDGYRLWHTFHGSTSSDWGKAIALDDYENIYVTGQSDATWGSPVQAHSAGTDYDIFVLKLDSGGALQWNTFHGSDTTDDDGYGIAVDSNNNVYITGESDSTWGEPVNSFYKDSVQSEIVIFKLDNNGHLQWNTFHGSSLSDRGSAIKVDGGNVYVAGESRLTWGSPINPHAGAYGNGDIVVLKLDTDGALGWNTFHGSASEDWANGIAVDSSGNIYVVGIGYDTWGMPKDAFAGNIDIQIVKLIPESACLATPFQDRLVYDSFYQMKGNYSTFATAYADSVACGQGMPQGCNTILMQAMEFSGPFNLNLDRSFTLLGGYYGCGFSVSGGYTTFTGSLTIGGLSKAVFIDRLVIK